MLGGGRASDVAFSPGRASPLPRLAAPHALVSPCVIDHQSGLPGRLVIAFVAHAKLPGPAAPVVTSPATVIVAVAVKAARVILHGTIKVRITVQRVGNGNQRLYGVMHQLAQLCRHAAPAGRSGTTLLASTSGDSSRSQWSAHASSAARFSGPQPWR